MRQCQRRLERIVQTGAKKGINKPTAEDIDYARVCLLCFLAYCNQTGEASFILIYYGVGLEITFITLSCLECVLHSLLIC